METICETAVTPSAETPPIIMEEKDSIAEIPNIQQFPSTTSALTVSNLPTSTHFNLPSKFKRTNSVSFNVGSARSARSSVDIRNMPSLAHKRASIVDVAKGAMSSLMHSFASSTGGGDMSPIPDDEPIFEEPIAPTLSLGQRVALVKNSGAEFGTVGWIGQLFDVDDDWMVGVIFDNMIGDCDGAYKGVRYFYARMNYAMFVPLSTLTKTDNYIGRPETGTMLSRMSVSLKPGQLISIQRSSIRLQHCFLNAPHQRVGHDVRAVSNRLHCQCHNCGPCAHLTKQASRMSALGPAFGAHHAPNKKNSLAHAAVEILAHHHHHYHEEEHEEEDYNFGDNAAHACNFVRYSCCQQAGTGGHDFSADCEMVRPELLDNLIHAPKAPHRRSRPRRRYDQHSRHYHHRQQQMLTTTTTNEVGQVSTLDSALTIKSSWASTGETSADGASTNITREENYNGSASSYSSSSNSSSSRSSSASRDGGDGQQQYQHYDEHQQIFYESPSYHPGSSAFNTIDTQMSLMDQQRFIYQRDSSAFTTRSQQESNLGSDDYYDEYEQESSFGSSVRRCFNCLLGRKSAPKRQKKRRMSTKNRNLEYRRKQFTFVPSTLAKPHEDFASHGIIMPGSSHSAEPQQQDEYNSDYSSFSKSSHSSRGNSPVNATSCDIETVNQQQQLLPVENELGVQNQGELTNQSLAGVYNIDSTSNVNLYGADQVSLQNNNYVSEEYNSLAENVYVNTSAINLEVDQLQLSGQNVLESSSNDQQLKSSYNNMQSQQRQLDYDDYTYSNSDNNYGTYKKNCYSCESALTDMGYFGGDTWNTNSSNDTLKNIVEQTINDQIGLPEPILYNDCDEPLSPIVSVSGSNQSDEQVDVSSPTASLPMLDNDNISQDNHCEAKTSNQVVDDDDDVCQSMSNLNLEGENEKS